MPKYNVVLDALLRGASAFSTDDEIEAESAEEAERKAIEQWRAVEPDFTFHPLFTSRQSE